MVLQAIAFYVFSMVAILAGLFVISSRNPVHSVLFLILAFFNAAGLFVLLGAELLAMTLVIVYVGAVAVLFLFVVMMLDINFTELRQGFLNYLPFGALIGLALLAELVFVLGIWQFSGLAPENAAAPTPPIDAVSNAEALGQIIYTQYAYFFQAAGIILLIAMIGAIVLTLRTREGVKRQNIAAQVGRTREASVEIKEVQPGQGL
jgi:NADH-quinone oxidoreductase subunit J